MMATAGAPSRPTRGATDRGRDPLLIAVERCKGCELCVSACPAHVLALDPGRINGLGHHPVRLTDAALCTSCALCAKVCPDAVFTVFAPDREVRT